MQHEQRVCKLQLNIPTSQNAMYKSFFMALVTVAWCALVSVTSVRGRVLANDQETIAHILDLADRHEHLDRLSQQEAFSILAVSDPSAHSARKTAQANYIKLMLMLVDKVHAPSPLTPPFDPSSLDIDQDMLDLASVEEAALAHDREQSAIFSSQQSAASPTQSVSGNENENRLDSYTDSNSNSAFSSDEDDANVESDDLLSTVRDQVPRIRDMTALAYDTLFNTHETSEASS